MNIQRTPNGTSNTAREYTPTNQNWRLFTNAICAFMPDGYERVPARSVLDSNQNNFSVSCPVGKTAIGPAVRVNGGNGHVVLDDLVPSEDNRSDLLAAFEDPTASPRTGASRPPPRASAASRWAITWFPPPARTTRPRSRASTPTASPAR